MGCMAGFFQMFDRHHILIGKKRLSHSVVKARNSPPETEKKEQIDASKESPAKKEIQAQAAPVELPSKRALPLAAFELKERGVKLYSWRLYREAPPRLSLDSRATFDANLGSLRPREIRTRGTTSLASRRSECSEDISESDAEDKQLRSPCVVARLMGLELIPQSTASPAKIQLRRSASESRIAYNLTDADNFQDQSKFTMRRNKQSNVKKNNAITGGRTEATISRSDSQSNKLKASSPSKAAQQQPKSFFNSADFFPEHAEMEKRLRMRGMDEQFKDLEALKNIMEALQLKGLLHSSKISDHLLIKTVRNNSSANLRSRKDMKRGKERTSQAFTSLSPRRQSQPEVKKSPGRKENKERINPISSVGRRSLPSQRKANEEVTEQRRSVSPAHSPRPSVRRNGSNQSIAIAKNKKQMAEIAASCPEDRSSSISENSVSNFSQTERSKLEECKGGKSLIERCDKLLHSIAEMNVAESQPSPVSVLDYKLDDSATPSPAMSRRTIDFKESDEETWIPATISPMDEPDKCDFENFTKILRASSCVPQEHLKQQDQNLGETSSRSNRNLIIDSVSEIISQKEQLPEWEEDSWSPSTKEEKKAWMEFQNMQEREAMEENEALLRMVRAALKKDMAGEAEATSGWNDRHVETGEVVLDMERMIFRDLIEETIREVAFCGKIGSPTAASRRRLVY